MSIAGLRVDRHATNRTTRYVFTQGGATTVTDTTDRRSTVTGGPTKRLFVSMLTRDIELIDAILDLVDNCVDGAMRRSRDRLSDNCPYTGFSASLQITDESFTLRDNCGGIPEDYIDGAFRLGRPNIKKDGDIPTIGMYGIGMKRAIFKMAKSAHVTSNSDQGRFRVTYSEEWLDPDNDDWDLPIERTEGGGEQHGVIVDIPSLKADIKRAFDDPKFLSRLQRSIASHFGYIMQKGFEIKLNETSITPNTIHVFAGEEDGNEQDISPFVFSGAIDNVDVKIVVGFFRRLVPEKEIQDDAATASRHDKSGISVVCNDRVILMSDKTAKTGWGDGVVPRFHPQFRAIAGLITFYSEDAEKLPISTTKRGLDVGSDVYFHARKYAMEGIKAFTDFTNKWKGMEDETNAYFERSKESDAKTASSLASSKGRQVRGLPGAHKFVPKLPLPRQTNPKRRISFLKTDTEVRIASEHLFGEPGEKPSIVGESCFDKILGEANSNERE